MKTIVAQLSVLAFLSYLAVSCSSVDTPWLKSVPFSAAPLRGMVYDRSGRPCRGLTVIVDKHETLTDINGRFLIPDLTAGEHRLKLSGESFVPLESTFVFSDRKQVFHAVVHRRSEARMEAEKALIAGEWAAAEILLFPGERIPSNDPEILWLQIFLLHKTGHGELASEWLDHLSELKPGNPWISLFGNEME
jgi:hypothetical protein